MKPIVHNEQATIYAEKPDYSPIKSPFKELNNPALKNIEVCSLTDDDLTKPVDISKIKNRIIMDNVNLNEILQYWNYTDSKYKFIAGIMWKVTKAAVKLGYNLASNATIFVATVGGKVLIKQVLSGPAGIGLGLAAASSISFNYKGEKQSLLQIATKEGANAAVDTTKTVLTEVGKGIANSEVGKKVTDISKKGAQKVASTYRKGAEKVSSISKDVADTVVSGWQKGKSWFGFK